MARGAIDLRPPPGFRWNFCLRPSRGSRAGSSGSTRDQSSLETSHDCTFGMDETWQNFKNTSIIIYG
jgi:hypothetical protein